MSKTREWSGWAFGAVMFVITIVGMWLTYHSQFASKDDVSAVRAEANANATVLFQTQKNIQRGRLMSYDGVPEEKLSPVEKKQKQIIQYDLQNIETVERAVGLEAPTND